MSALWGNWGGPKSLPDPSTIPGWRQTAFGFSSQDVLDLVTRAKAILAKEANLIEVTGESKLFGDIHGESLICDFEFLYGDACSYLKYE